MLLHVLRVVLARHRGGPVCAIALAPTVALLLGGLHSAQPVGGFVPLPSGGRVPLWVVALSATCLLLSPLLAPEFLTIEAALSPPRRLVLAPVVLAHLVVVLVITPLALNGLLIGAVTMATAFLAVGLVASAVLRTLNWVASATASIAILTVLADHPVYQSLGLLTAGGCAWLGATLVWWLRYRRLWVT